MKYPKYFNMELDDVTNINACSQSFAFLREEPDIYTIYDLNLE